MTENLITVLSVAIYMSLAVMVLSAWYGAFKFKKYASHTALFLSALLLVICVVSVL